MSATDASRRGTGQGSPAGLARRSCLVPALLWACGGKPEDTTSQGPEPEPELTEGLPQFVSYRPRNVLFLSMDTLRRDHMGPYGGPGVTSFLDDLASQSFTLDRHQSCSNWTAGGVLCVLDGKGRLDAGFIPHLVGGDDAPARTTLASTLTDAGFHTILQSANGWLMRLNIPYGYEVAEEPDTDFGWGIYVAGRDKLLELQATDPKPWFLHVHIKEPHIAYNPPDEYLTELQDLPPVDYDLTEQTDYYGDLDVDWPLLPPEEQALLLQHMQIRYRGEIRWMDDQIRNMWNDLDSHGLLDDTLVVFWTDHGEQFFEHGNLSHANTLHGEETNSFVYFWAKNIVPGSWDEPTWHPDIAPTVLRAIGQPVPTDMTGVPLGEAPADRAIVTDTAGRTGPKLAITYQDLRLHYDWDGMKEFYDLAADPTEAHDLYDPEDPRVIDLWERFMPSIEQATPILADYGPPTDPGP